LFEKTVLFEGGMVQSAFSCSKRICLVCPAPGAIADWK
jgi:hypothetical protein